MRKTKIEQEIDIEEMIKQMKSIDFDAVNKCIIETATSVVNKLVEMYEDVCNSEPMKVEEPKPTCYCSGRITKLKCTEKCKHYYDCEINRQYRTMLEYDFNARKEINSIKCFGKYSKECLSNTCILYDLCKKTTKEKEECEKEINKTLCDDCLMSCCCNVDCKNERVTEQMLGDLIKCFGKSYSKRTKCRACKYKGQCEVLTKYE